MWTDHLLQAVLLYSYESIRRNLELYDESMAKSMTWDLKNKNFLLGSRNKKFAETSRTRENPKQTAYKKEERKLLNESSCFD